MDKSRYSNDISEKAAKLMLNAYADRCVSAMSNELDAIILTGSLATNSYIGIGEDGRDVDQITILKDSAEDNMRERTEQIRKEVMERYFRRINISDVVYKQSDLHRPWYKHGIRPKRSTKHYFTIPEELLRIKDHGIVIYGAASYIDSLTCPSMAEMRDYHSRWREWGRRMQEDMRERGMKIITDEWPWPLRISVAMALTRAIWYYYYSTGKTQFSKNDIAATIESEIPDCKYLDVLRLATEIRKNPGKYKDDYEVRLKIAENVREFKELDLY